MIKTLKPDAFHIFTDGACSGNPGPGGWGCVVFFNGEQTELSGGERETTNNRMELMAAIRALEAQTPTYPIHLYTDSNYVKDGITKWVEKWQANGWRTAGKEPVKNQDLWQELLTQTQGREIHWHWVKGHSGHPGNERADLLARNAIVTTIMAESIKKSS